MLKIKRIYLLIVFTTLSLFCLVLLNNNLVYAEEEKTVDLSSQNIKKVEDFAREVMKTAKIPGMSVVIVKDNEIPYIKGFGYSNVDRKIPVTADTLFEVASCSKSYTAVAVLQLRDKGLIRLDDPVSKYFPWFYATYKNQKYEITIRQLLHHTSGIPFASISLIPISDKKDSLDQVVRNISGIKLSNIPGEKFEYATVNYDILGAIIQKVSGKMFEDCMEENVFKPLLLNNTFVYPQDSNLNMAKGYKYSFFRPQEYVSPVFKGNRPAGYIITNAKDMARWLMLQLGTVQSNYSSIFKETQIPDRTVEPRLLDRSSYAMGWASYQIGSGEIAKAGMNPSFSAYMTFRPEDKIGVGVLTNFNSEYTFAIGKGIIDILQGKKPSSFYIPEEGLTSWDKPFTIISVFSITFSVVILGYLFIVVFEWIKGKRRRKNFDFKDIKALLLPLLLIMILAYAIYIFPKSFDYTWMTAIVWLPQSFLAAVISIVALMVLGYLYYTIVYFVPLRDDRKNQIPKLVVLSVLSGISNYAVIALINNQIYDNKNAIYKMFYFLLAMFVYIFGRKIIETGLINITNHVIYEKRMSLLQFVFSTSYSQYEKLDNGRILATLNYDTETVGNAANVLVSFITYSITIVCCFIYMGTISLLGMAIILGIVLVVAVLYAIVSDKVGVYWEDARNTQDTFMKHIDNLLNGFKELALHRKKKIEFKDDVDDSCTEYRDKRNLAKIKFLNVYLVGETMLILVLGAIVFFLPSIFKSIYANDGQNNYKLVQFVVTFLYIIGPINGVMGSLPEIVKIRVSWKKIENFVKDIPQMNPMLDMNNDNPADINVNVSSVRLDGITYKYDNNENINSSFSIGPINFEFHKGEIIFVTGGNGSGKTTLAKLITGLYSPTSGLILLNGRKIDSKDLGELFSTVFSDFHLFDRLYAIDFNGKDKIIDKYLKLLNLDGKVKIINGRFNTTKLSAGQRKRLALLICLLEDRPIYLFDEWAADQDPQFRKFFYRNLLPDIKASGKIVIAISHDDHYYDVADKILKMDEGKVDNISEQRIGMLSM